MVLNSKECRRNAQRCIEMANQSLDADVQSRLLDMAEAWTQIAVELECAEAREPGVKLPK
jgi:hypothetical protein